MCHGFTVTGGQQKPCFRMEKRQAARVAQCWKLHSPHLFSRSSWANVLPEISSHLEPLIIFAQIFLNFWPKQKRFSKNPSKKSGNLFWKADSCHAPPPPTTLLYVQAVPQKTLGIWVDLHNVKPAKHPVWPSQSSTGNRYHTLRTVHPPQMQLFEGQALVLPFLDAKVKGG